MRQRSKPRNRKRNRDNGHNYRSRDAWSRRTHNNKRHNRRAVKTFQDPSGKPPWRIWGSRDNVVEQRKRRSVWG